MHKQKLDQEKQYILNEWVSTFGLRAASPGERLYSASLMVLICVNFGNTKAKCLICLVVGYFGHHKYRKDLIF